MFQQIDLRELAEMSGPERAFVSLYATGPEALSSLDDRADKVRALLDDETEREHFEESLLMIREELEGYEFDEEGLAVFSCWALDFFVGYPLTKKPSRDLLWIDSSPYIRPLAELQDGYEDFLVVAADASRARVFLVSSARVVGEASARGDVKNRVKKGGWSQKRYQRRREGDIQHFAKEIADIVRKAESTHEFDRLILLGTQEVMNALESALPKPVAAKIAGKRITGLEESDDGDRDPLLEQAFELFFEAEREEERSLWEQISDEYMRGGLAAAGPREVLAAAQEGRVEELVVTRDAKIAGMRCRECELLAVAKPQQCPRCDSSSVFKVDLVNEIVELLEQSGGSTDFVDPIEGLSEVGDIAALLRYQPG